MDYKVFWQPTAYITYFEEIDFILSKWNYSEVLKFRILVNENINRLRINPLIEVFNKKYNFYSLVISKQTTLYHKIEDNQNQIELYVFWNNLKNPVDLIKLL